MYQVGRIGAKGIFHYIIIAAQWFYDNNGKKGMLYIVANGFPFMRSCPTCQTREKEDKDFRVNVTACSECSASTLPVLCFAGRTHNQKFNGDVLEHLKNACDRGKTFTPKREFLARMDKNNPIFGHPFALYVEGYPIFCWNLDMKWEFIKWFKVEDWVLVRRDKNDVLYKYYNGGASRDPRTLPIFSARYGAHSMKSACAQETFEEANWVKRIPIENMSPVELAKRFVFQLKDMREICFQDRTVINVGILNFTKERSVYWLNTVKEKARKEKDRENLSYEKYMHVVQLCDETKNLCMGAKFMDVFPCMTGFIPLTVIGCPRNDRFIQPLAWCASNPFIPSLQIIERLNKYAPDIFCSVLEYSRLVLHEQGQIQPPVVAQEIPTVVVSDDEEEAEAQEIPTVVVSDDGGEIPEKEKELRGIPQDSYGEQAVGVLAMCEDDSCASVLDNAPKASPNRLKRSYASASFLWGCSANASGNLP